MEMSLITKPMAMLMMIKNKLKAMPAKEHRLLYIKWQ